MTTLVSFFIDNVRQKRKDMPDMWSNVNSNATEKFMFRGYPYLDAIPTDGTTPVAYDDFVIDIDTKALACGDAIKIIDWFANVYGVEFEQWRIYLSGSKGIHLELPAEILGTEKGHQLLMVGYKRLALDIEAELMNINIDTSMYTKGIPKPFRQPNVMRETGTCKRQIEFNDLYEILNENEYKTACTEPGRTWEPENIELNPVLSEKIKQYLIDAEKADEVLKNIPPLTPDQIDRLVIDSPQCVTVLANSVVPSRSPGSSPSTFNDVAMQITAYAVTVGMSEQEFLQGANVFISKYPSTSLNTLEKRLENCRARYRTMKANGNRFSCAGVRSLRFGGFDCSECKNRIETPVPSVVEESSDLWQPEEENMSLQMPAALRYPGGIFDLGMRGLLSPGYPPMWQYVFPLLCSVIARAISGKIICDGVWPNIYSVKVGPTSIGKSEGDKAIKKYLSKILPGFVGLTEIASGPGLTSSLSKTPIMLFMSDECTDMFVSGGANDGLAVQKRKALLQHYSGSGETTIKSYSNAQNNIRVESPCLTFVGNTTPSIFDALTDADYGSGLIPRFDFFAWEGIEPYRGRKTNGGEQLVKKFVEGLATLINCVPPKQNIANIINPIDIGMDSDCEIVRDKYSRDIIDRKNAETDEGRRGIVGRSFDGAIKYAMLHHACASSATSQLFQPLTAESLEWGISVVSILCDWKLNVLTKKVASGEFHRRQLVFEKAVKAAMVAAKKAEKKKGAVKRRPTYGWLKIFQKELDNWTKKESGEIISVLSKGKLVLEDMPGKRTAYYWKK